MRRPNRHPSVIRRLDGHTHRSAARNMTVALVLTLGLFLFEWLGGQWSNSLALQGDAWHMLFDALAILAAQIGLRLEDTNPRLSAVLALANGLFLCVPALYIMEESLDRFRESPAVHGNIGLFVAVVSLFVNLAIVQRLYHHHHHLNVQGVMVHVLADTGASVLAVVSTAVVAFHARAAFVDTALGLLIAFGLAAGGMILVKRALAAIIHPPWIVIPFRDLQGKPDLRGQPDP
jgi:cobalt-zinc-cadmium efflux system protein